LAAAAQELAGLVGLEIVPALAEQLDEALDGRQRCTQVVGDGRQDAFLAHRKGFELRTLLFELLLLSLQLAGRHPGFGDVEQHPHDQVVASLNGR
jgi:hypothetical protein